MLVYTELRVRLSTVETVKEIQAGENPIYYRYLHSMWKIGTPIINHRDYGDFVLETLPKEIKDNNFRALLKSRNI